MKIIYICNSDFGKHGNIGFRTYYVAKEAERQGKLVKVICRGFVAKNIPKYKIETINFWYRSLNLMLSGITQYIFKNFPARNIQLKLFDLLVSKELRKDQNHYDLLHIYEYAPKTIAEAKKKGLKVVLDTQMAHGKTADKIFNLKRSHNIENQSAKLADKIICSSKFVIDSYIDAGINQNKLSFVPHGVDLNKFELKENNLEIKDQNDQFTVLFVGIVEKRKGIQYLLEAWTKLNWDNAELIICGLINKEGKEFVKKYKNNDSIKFMGFTEPTKYYKSADVFILPSIFESSAKVLYEAMAAELPIITTFNAGPPFEDGEAGFIIPTRDEKLIREKLVILKESSQLRMKMGKTGKQIVQDYSWGNYGKKILKVYDF